MIKIIARCGQSGGAQAAEGAPRRVRVSQESSLGCFSAQRLPGTKVVTIFCRARKARLLPPSNLGKMTGKEYQMRTEAGVFLYTSFDLRTS